MKNSLKYIGFIVVLAGVVLLIRPDLFFGSNNTTEQEDVQADQPTRQGNASADDSDYTDPRKPSLLAKNNKVNPDGITEYADGYSEDDFGDAFQEPENMFQISENEGRQSAGGLWETLLELKFDIALDEALNDVVMRPMFTKDIKALNNKVVEIEGFIVPFEIVADATGRDDGSMFMLSAFPSATCFFCKGAGPESVMEVYPAKPIPYSKDKVKIKGKLILNDFDYLKMAYILEDAEMVE